MLKLYIFKMYLTVGGHVVVCGRKPEHPDRIHASMRRTGKLPYTQKVTRSDLGIEPRTYLQ